jgi:hypothetical protein
MAGTSSLEQILAALTSFKSLIDPGLRDGIQLSELYRVRSQRNNEVHWPKNWEDVWGRKVTGGVYFHFDEDDRLLYVGVSVALMVRLNSYYKYVDYPRDLSCFVNDGRLTERGSGIRVIILDDPLRILAASLELHLIETLRPPLNTKHVPGEPVPPIPQIT